MKIDSTEGRSGRDPFPGIPAAQPAKSSTGLPAAAGARHRAPNVDTVDINRNAARRLAVSSQIPTRPTDELRPHGSGGRSFTSDSDALDFVAAYNRLMGDAASYEASTTTAPAGVDVSA